MKEHPDEAQGQPVEPTPTWLQGNTWELPSDPRVIGVAANEFVQRLRQAGVVEDTAIDLEIGFREALANAVVHGNKGILSSADDTVADALHKSAEQGADKKVLVILAISGSEVRATVRDEGSGFDATQVADPRSEERLSIPSGRGLLLMRTFFDEVTYNETGNEVTLIKHLLKK